jgi:hypothetical protein
LNAEIKRRNNVVGIIPNDASIVRLVYAMMLEQNDEWSLSRRYMQIEVTVDRSGLWTSMRRGTTRLRGKSCQTITTHKTTRPTGRPALDLGSVEFQVGCRA